MLDFSHWLRFFVFLPIVFTAAMTTKIRNGRMPSAAGRIELFFKSPSELQDRVRFLRSNGIASFNLVNKDKKDDVDGWIDSIREVYPEADISAHYSLKHNKVPRKGIEQHKELWLTTLENSKADEILMVSGSGPKKQWNALEALDALNNASGAASSEKPSHPKIAVAYNPYFPSREDREKENRRLVEKLATGCVSKIYLQFGTDMECLQKGLDFIETHKTKGLSVSGSLFLPTKKLIAQQKFRPWNGVFLSSEFLEGPEQASAIVLEIIRVYQANNVEFLWEAPGIRTEKDLEMVRELLNEVGKGQQSRKPIDSGNIGVKDGVSPKRVPDKNDASSTTKRRKQSSFK